MIYSKTQRGTKEHISCTAQTEGLEQGAVQRLIYPQFSRSNSQLTHFLLQHSTSLSSFQHFSFIEVTGDLAGKPKFTFSRINTT